MGRPPSDLDDYAEWQRRLECYQGSNLDLNMFCLQEGVSRSTFYRWKDRLKDGIPKSIESDGSLPEPVDSSESVFVPISIKSSPVEVELPNGGVVRIPERVGRDVLVAIIRVVGSLRPWKAPPS